MKKLLIPAVILAFLFLFFFTLNPSGNIIKTKNLPSQERNYLSPEVFRNLPQTPGNFRSVLEKFRSGVLSTQDLTEAYYKQPELYPTFDQNIGLMEHPRQHWGVMGFGAYPSDVRVASGRNTEAVFATLIHASWLVETSQGMSLVPVFEKGAENYFDVSLDPNTLLLEPAYPVFGENWTHKVTINLKIKDPPAGRYEIGILPSSPASESSAAWPSLYPKYRDAGGFGVGRPLFRMTVDIQ